MRKSLSFIRKAALFDSSFTLTKRQLGLLAVGVGILALIGGMAYDLLGVSDPNAGLGPSQKLGLLAAFMLILFGITLLPLGNRPA